MATLSVSHIDYIKEHINEFEPLTFINASKDDVPEVTKPTHDKVYHVLDSYVLFRDFTQTVAKIEAQYNGDNSIIAIEIFSQTSDRVLWVSCIFYLKTSELHCYNLGI